LGGLLAEGWESALVESPTDEGAAEGEEEEEGEEVAAVVVVVVVAESRS